MTKFSVLFSALLFSIVLITVCSAADPTIVDEGKYWIRAKHSNLVLDTRFANSNGAYVTQQTRATLKSQTFVLSWKGYPKYSTNSLDSGKVLDAMSTNVGTLIQLQPYSSARATQFWTFYAAV